MVMSLHVNGRENYQLQDLSLSRRLQVQWPPDVPGFKESKDADKEDYEYSSKYQGTVVEHWENVVLSVPYAIVCFYMLVGLNTVCDAYFTGALDVMVERWQVQPDVAGATFMAAGGSAPEFFTSIIGACLAESDVGFGTIVGSAVFNVLFVIGACGVAAKEPIKLTWWPLLRDCTFYIIGLGLLAALCFTTKDDRDFSGKEYTQPNSKCTDATCTVVGPQKTVTIKEGDRMGCPPIPGIEHWEAVVLFLLYLCYCLLMYFNEKMERLIKGQVARISDSSGKVHPEEDAETTEKDSGDKLKEAATADAGPPSQEPKQAAGEGGDKDATTAVATDPVEEPPETKVEVPEDGDTKAEEKKEEEAEEEKEEEDEDACAGCYELMEVPEGNTTADVFARVRWYICSPIYVQLYYCTPLPRPDKFCGVLPSYIACFLTSLLWIAIYSTILVWLVTELGAVFGFPEIVMGFTVLAAGTSIPDLVSSMAVAKEGEGDMAVSSSIGSNIFDILVGLPIPWLVKILLVEGIGNADPGFLVVIQSPYIPAYVLLLLLMVAAVVITIHCMKWTLKKELGVVMVVLYIIFLGIVLPTSYDAMPWLNVAGDGRQENPKAVCPPDPLEYK
jgi:sodium/potassium/calcium exchanger 2